MKNKDFIISVGFAAIGLMAGALIAMYLLVSAVQTGVFAFLSSFIGLKLARKTNLSLNFKYDKGSFFSAVVIAFLIALIISVSEKLIFAPYMPGNLEGTYKFNLLYLLTSILYGGVIEELLLRLLFMSFVVFILKKMLRTDDESIPSWIYTAAITVSALLFAAGHLPTASQMFGLSALMVIRVLVLNSVAGFGYGYLYWKRGLAYSILAHMLTHVFNQLILLPLFF